MMLRKPHRIDTTTYQQELADHTCFLFVSECRSVAGVIFEITLLLIHSHHFSRWQAASCYIRFIELGVKIIIDI